MSIVRSLLSRGAFLGLTPGLMLTALASNAWGASSITGISVVNGDLVVDKTATLAISGFSDPAEGQSLQVHLNPAALQCAATPSANSERRVDSSSANLPEGTFAIQANFPPPAAPGDFVFCVYQTDWFSNVAYASASAPARIRQPNTTLGVTLPQGRQGVDVDWPIQVTVSAEVERRYSVEVNPVGVPCAPNKRANQEAREWVWNTPILGGPFTYAHNVSVSEPGQYVVCGYVGDGYDDAAPTTAYTGPTFWAGPPPRCKVGRAPRRPSSKVTITCTGTTGPIAVSSRRGKKRFSTSVSLVGGRGVVSGRAIGLKRKKRVTVSLSVDGQQVGSRILRVR